jgi:uncharacterized membrane protein
MSHIQDVSKLSLIAAVAGALTLAVSVPAPAVAAGKVKCYGIAKAGENDCANVAGTHSCAAQSTVDFAGDEWKAVAAEDCEKLGGKTEPFQGAGTGPKT